MSKTLQDWKIRLGRPGRLAAAAPVALIMLAGCVAYWNSFQGVFVFDDPAAIAENATIRTLWPPGPVLSPPQDGSPVTGRPVVNLSLAVNYALGGTEPWGYHAANLAIHILAGLVLFGIVRRTLLLPRVRERFGARSTGLALAAALIWLVHPLQTESVTYVCQRAESLAGLLYLATVYCCIRAFQTDRGITWKIAGVTLCLLGMATKETVATVPLVVLLYDRTFVSQTFREALRKRWGLYSSLAATWALLAALVFQGGSRGGTAGFGAGISSWEYAQTQFGAIVHYLRLCFWPNPLVLDYGRGLATGAWQIAPYAVVVAILLIATLVSIRYLPGVGFLGACFFLILAPSSSVVPVVTQTTAEHRMYLPLAAVIVMVVILADWAWARLGSLALVARLPAVVCWAIPVAAVGAVVAGQTYLTVLRNNDYHSALSIWQDTVRNVPSHYGARYNLGNALASRGQIAKAIEQYHQALKLKPNYPEAHNNLGAALASRGQIAEAIEHYHQALKLKPNYPDAYNNLGAALASRGQVPEAIEQFHQALKAKPDYADAHINLGLALASRGQVAEAIEQYRQALTSEPDSIDAHINLGLALASRGQVAEAIEQYQRALRSEPNHAEARNNLGVALASRGQVAEAIQQYYQALNSKPDFAEAHNNLGVALASQGQLAEAIEQYHQAIQARPGYPDAYNNLGIALASQGQVPQAVEQFRHALRSRPDYADAHINLGIALASQGQVAEAIEQYRQALKSEPDYPQAHYNLGAALASRGQVAEAIEQYRQALESRPDYPEAHNGLGTLLATQGRVDEAIRHFEQALQLRPDYAVARENLNKAVVQRRGADRPR